MKYSESVLVAICPQRPAARKKDLFPRPHLVDILSFKQGILLSFAWCFCLYSEDSAKSVSWAGPSVRSWKEVRKLCRSLQFFTHDAKSLQWWVWKLSSNHLCNRDPKYIFNLTSMLYFFAFFYFTVQVFAGFLTFLNVQFSISVTTKDKVILEKNWFVLKGIHSVALKSGRHRCVIHFKNEVFFLCWKLQKRCRNGPTSGSFTECFFLSLRHVGGRNYPYRS